MSINVWPFHLFRNISIRTKIWTNAAITISLAMVVGLTASVSYRDIGQAARSERFAVRVINDVSTLNSLSYTYLLLRNKRSKEQWQLKHASLGKILSNHSVRKREEQVLLEGLRDDHEQMKKLFDLVSERIGKSRPRPWSVYSPDDERIEGISIQLMERVEMISHKATRFAREYGRLMDEVRQASFILIFVSAFILIVSASLTAFLSAKNIGGAIHLLEQGTQQIAAGDLGHRVEVSRNDEIGRLSAAFNDMAAKLGISYHRLEAEIFERRKANDELKKSGKRLQHLSSQLLAAQEEERRRIAADVHDCFGASLSAVKYQIEFALRDIGENQKLRDAMNQILHAMNESRRIQMALRPSILDDLGILAALKWLCREFRNTYSHIEVKSQLNVEEQEVPFSIKTVIFRIVQEALNNVAKHSQASSVTLALTTEGSFLNLAVQDNGVGFGAEVIEGKKAGQRGLGLASMEERASISGGVFSIHASAERGTLVRVSWPLRESVLSKKRMGD